MRVAGPDACEHLQNMVSNDAEALRVGDACPALLLTAKARVIAPVVVWRRGEEDFLVLTEPELGGAVRGERRFAGVAELIAQMHRDIEVARELCASFTRRS